MDEWKDGERAAREGKGGEGEGMVGGRSALLGVAVAVFVWCD